MSSTRPPAPSQAPQPPKGPRPNSEEIDYDRLARMIAAHLAPLIAPPRRLLTKRELCDALRIGPAMVDRYAREGMPREYVGRASPRFDIDACRTWIEEHARPRPAPLFKPSPEVPIPGVRRLSLRKAS